MNSASSLAVTSFPRGLKAGLRRAAPSALWLLLQEVRAQARLIKYRALGRPARAGETAKAHARRRRDGFFEKYCVGHGLDIGYGGDLLSDNCFGWDVEHGDAQFLEGIEDASFDFVYSSHTLEHVAEAPAALRNWYRALKPGGHLILFVPDRDLYEKRLTLPSRWNPDHRRFFLLHRDEPPDTVGLLPLIDQVLPEAVVVSANRCDDGHTVTEPLIHSDGEYSIEVILRKPRS